MCATNPVQLNSALVCSRASGYSIPDIAGTVAAMTECDPAIASEKASHNTPGEPGQRHEVGKAFGC